METIKKILNGGRRIIFAIFGIIVIFLLFNDIYKLFTTQTGVLYNFNGSIWWGILLYIITFLISLNLILQLVGYKKISAIFKKK